MMDTQQAVKSLRNADASATTYYVTPANILARGTQEQLVIKGVFEYRDGTRLEPTVTVGAEEFSQPGGETEVVKAMAVQRQQFWAEVRRLERKYLS